ncbi:MAG: thioredoxin family protein [Bacteroidota bacterium]
MQLDFNLLNVDGKFVSLSDQTETDGFVVVFTCNHCPYAVAYELRLNALADFCAAANYPLIAINPNDDTRYPMDSYAQMQVRARQRGFTFAYLRDESQVIARNYGAERTPHAFVLHRGANGLEMVYQGAIDDNWQNERQVQENYIKTVIGDLKAGHAPSHQRTPAVGCTVKWKG